MHLCMAAVTLYVPESICVSVRVLIVSWVDVNGLSQSIYLQEKVCEQTAHRAGDSY